MLLSRAKLLVAKSLSFFPLTIYLVENQPLSNNCLRDIFLKDLG